MTAAGPRVIGLTGGIGSGKSTVAELLRGHGVPVIDADTVARDCTAPGSPVLDAVLTRFGPGVRAADGSLDRAALAAIVFADPVARRDLEALTHPCIRAGIASRLRAVAATRPTPAVVVVEHPLLVEADAVRDVDAVVLVEAPAEVRVARVAAGRGMDPDDVRARIASQADDATRRAVADHVLVNDGDLAALSGAVAALLPVLAGSGRSS